MILQHGRDSVPLHHSNTMQGGLATAQILVYCPSDSQSVKQNPSILVEYQGTLLTQSAFQSDFEWYRLLKNKQHSLLL